MSLKIPIETSARHIHITQEDFETLFGPGTKPTFAKELSQPGQYACKERLTVAGPKGRFEKVVILGPCRKETQVEISVTDARRLGIKSVIRQSGDLEGTPGCTLIGPKGKLELSRGVIVAKRHIHMTPVDAIRAHVKDNDIVFVITTSYERSLIFSDVVVRVSPSYSLAMHVDTDEANAFANEDNPTGVILKLFNGHTYSLQNWAEELQAGIDSLEKISSESASASYEPLLNTFIFPFDKSLASDSIPHVDMPRAELAEKIENLPVRSKVSIYDVALNKARNSRSYYSFDEATSKEALNQLYRYKVEWHKKMSLPVSIMIFFLIGAPLGAIIRKGGLGMPVVVSVGFFVIYYIITITGEKMAREGSWDSFLGMWIATFILLPISVYLTYKATNDSNLFNAEWYLARYKKISAFFRSLFRRNALRGGLPPAGTAGSETR